MKRREFITLLGGAAVGWPLTARAQQASKLPIIGFLGESTPSGQRQWVAAFVQRLNELGWVEGHNVAIEYRWAEGRNDRFADLSAEIVRRKVDVIVTQGTPAVLAAKQATTVIPIIFPIAGNPVANGLVASLARPGGNVTGLTNQTSDLAGKRLELLREVVPGLRRLAIMANVDNASVALDVDELRAAARALALEVVMSEIRRAEDIGPAIEACQGRVEALYVAGDPLVTTNRNRIAILAVGARLPSIHGNR
jgi:putative ABC transport system substrate-binding protein